MSLKRILSEARHCTGTFHSKAYRLHIRLISTSFPRPLLPWTAFHYRSKIPHRFISSLSTESQSTAHTAYPSHDDSKPDRLVEQLADAVDTHDLSAIHLSLENAIHERTSAGPSQTLETSKRFRSTIIDVLRMLAATGESKDLNLIERTLVQMQNHWRLVVDSEVHDTILQGLLQNAQDITVSNWLRNMQDKPGGCRPTVEQWHAFLTRCKQEGKPNLVHSSMEHMRLSGCSPTQTTYRIMLEAYFRPGETIQTIPRLARIHHMIDQMQLDNVPFTLALCDIITAGCIDAGALSLGSSIERRYEKSNVQPALKDTSLKADLGRDRLLAGTVLEKGGKGRAVNLIERYKRQGYKPTMQTLAAVAENTTSVATLRFWEKHLCVKADSYIWSLVIRSALDKSKHYDALECFRTVQRCGIPLTPAIVHPMLRFLCAGKFRPPLDVNIDKALNIQRDYMEQVRQRKPSKGKGHGASDLPIYNTLLRGLTSSRNSQKYFPIALELVEEMQSRDIVMDSMTATSVIIMLMRSSSSVPEAFNMYKMVHKSQNGNYVLDTKGYIAVLDAFCKLTVPGNTPPNARLYFEIVKDMREATFTIPVEVYTILLRQVAHLLGKLDQADEEGRAQLVRVIRRTHDVISVDGSLVPDTILWNQLMDTYQRAGSFEDAYRLWQSIFISRKFDNASVSIILDACAFAGAADTAVEIYGKLHELGFRLNQRNWNNWLECLCRLGKLDEALKMFCLEMPQGRAGVGPDEDGARLLLSFAVRTNQEGEARSRIKRYLPDLWTKLPEDLRLGY